MAVRDEDFSFSRYHGVVELYGDLSAVDVPPATAQVVREFVDRSPEAWTPRLVWEDLQAAGRGDISEEQVAAVMTNA
jgi:hypothetical protein